MTMFRFVVVLIVVTANGYASSVDECRWGESYWCSSLENAELCGAFEHCKTTVWKNQILKADDGEFCAFCKSLINDVADFIKDNRTEQDILRFMKNACSVIPNKGVAAECSKLVEKFLVQILETIVNDLNPQSICALIRLCTGFEDTVVHSMLPKAPELIQAQPVAKVYSLEIRSEPICTDCKKFFTDIKNVISGNASEAQLEALIDLGLCSKLGTYESMCKELVKDYLPEIISLIMTEFDPNLICQSLGFCEKTLKEAKTFLIKLKLKRSEFYKMASMQTSNSAEDGCNICKIVMKDIRDLDQSAAVQNEIKDFLKSEICSRLSSYKTQCENLIDMYGQIVFELLANELDPESRCRSLGFCVATGNEIRYPTREATPAKTPASGQTVADSPGCTICKFVVGKIEEMLKQNATKQEIIDALDKICSLLPEALRDSCLSFVSEYASFIIDMLIQEFDPDLVCTTLKLCSGKPKTTLSKVSGSTECVVCEAIVQYVEALLLENSTLSQIEALVEKVCNFVPKSMKPECDFVVEKYGPFIIQYIATAMTPKSVCEHVGACPTKMTGSVKMAVLTEAKVVKGSAPIFGALECSWGPKYWCASKETANKCQATDYCNQIGWDL